MSARTHQLVTEVLETGTPSARTQQLVTEILETGTPSARTHQVVVEVLAVYVFEQQAPTGWITFQGLEASFSATLSAGNPASIVLTGEGATLVSTVMQVTVAGSPGVVNVTGQAATVVSYSTQATLNQRHVPCGHWHTGQSDNPVWDFIPQPDLPIPYHKDPVKPEICGHWHKTVSQTQPVLCIDYISECDAPGGEDHGVFKSSEQSFILGDRVICGSSDGIFFEVDTTLMGVVIQQSLGDITEIFQLQYIDDENFIALVKRSGYSGKWLQQVSRTGDSFSLVGDALYCGVVVIGSGGNIYGALNCLNVSAFWITLWTPITGSMWESGFELLPADYSGYVYSSLANYVALSGAEITYGSNVVNFKITSTGYLLNCGPTSSFLAYTSIPAFITSNGQYESIVGTNTIIGPNEVVYNDGGNYRLLRCTSAFTNLTLRNVETGVDTVVSGMLDENDIARDNSIYQSQLRWHVPNNRLYVLHQAYSDYMTRIAAIDPESGEVICQYVFGDGASSSNSACSFIIVGEYVYVWENTLGSANAVCTITKLTLDLEVVCIEFCEGSFSQSLQKSFELGGQLTSDGYYIYNWNNGDPVVGPKVTKYQINVAPSDVESSAAHSPVWPFIKQPDTW